jgi:transposase-like protein
MVIFSWFGSREVTGNVAMTCRYYGISWQVFYAWYRRYETEGPAGLRDRSKRPAHCPHETPAEVVAKIIYLAAELPLCLL